MDVNGWKWQAMTGMSGNSCKWMKMDINGKTYRKLLEMAGMYWNWLETAKKNMID